MHVLIRPIEQALQKKLTPINLQVIDESHLHHTPKGMLSHLKILVVSSEFSALTLVKRHQVIYRIIHSIAPEVHAISIDAFSPDESDGKTISASPTCRGGFKLS